MKKYLLLLLLFLLCSVAVFAQSLKFNDLVYFTNLSNPQVFDYLTQGSTFRQDYLMEVNGQQLEYFKNINGNKPNTEKLITGAYTKLANGAYLRTVTYTAQNGQAILSMIAQAQLFGLTLRFRGADYANNIYLLDDTYYQVSIYLKRDLTGGLVEIKQKQFFGMD